MREITYAEAIREALRQEMKLDDKVFVFGEDVGAFGGCFGVTAGLYDEFGQDRVMDTPISEAAILGTALGAALMGMRPVPEIMFVDFKKLTFPLSLRSWLPGDQFQPLGMQHKKKLSDFMIDEKIPLNLKKRVLVIAMGFEIVCVVGHRIDERFKVTPHTQEALMISSKYRDD